MLNESKIFNHCYRLRLRKYDNTVGTELLEFRQPYYDNDTRKGTAI